MKSPLIKILGMTTWVITALCALHVGFQALGYDLLMRLGLEGNPMVNLYAQYIVGIAGIISLIMFIMALTCGGCCGCGCECNSASSCKSNGYCSKCGSSPCRCVR